jgi:hypothetical protein
MRYVIETENNDILKTLNTWKESKKISMLDKQEFATILSNQLNRIRSALFILDKYGISRYVMLQFIRQETGLAKTVVQSVLDSQEDFLKKLGVKF